MYSAGHLSASPYDSPPQSAFISAPIPYRTCAPLATAPAFNPNMTYAPYDQSQTQPLINIHPDEVVGSNTKPPPELTNLAQLTPHHILSQAQQGRLRPASFSAPPTPDASSYFQYLPPGAFQTKPLMRRSSNLPSESSVPMKGDYDDGSYLMADQPSYVAMNSNGEYLQEAWQYEHTVQRSMSYEISETLLQPGFVRPDTYSPAPSMDYSPSPSLPITPPPSGTFPQQSFYIHQQQMMSPYGQAPVHSTGPVPLSSPSGSDDGCCNPRSLFVNPSATMT